VTTTQSGGISKYSIAWLSDASGDVSANSFNVKQGELLQVRTTPSVAAAPTDNYDVVINDANTYDILGGLGANRDTANTEMIVPVVSTTFPLILEAGALTPVVSNAGNAKQGTIVLLVR